MAGILDRYTRTSSEQTTDQQVLARIGNLILEIAIYYGCNQHYTDNTVIEHIN
ncbi:hypothetical protein [Bacteroides faecichinchillae]|uniref:hypothetical protein n=1 Tax=Bacteroides faecichinchillae TaxID=871325 RepID=UPI00131F04F0|nr:hypothetical protein [Bacteroides faecichinchillae]